MTSKQDDGVQPILNEIKINITPVMLF